MESEISFSLESLFSRMCHSLLKNLGMQRIGEREVIIREVNLCPLSHIQRDCLSVCGLNIFKNNLFAIFDDELDKEVLDGEAVFHYVPLPYVSLHDRHG